jgi:subtilisin family serine protease
MGDTNENREAFDPSVLDRSVIALPLLKRMEETPDKPLAVIIDLNLEYHEGRKAAGKAIQEDIDRLRRGAPDQGVNVAKSEFTNQYLFARLKPDVIRAIVESDRVRGTPPKGKKKSKKKSEAPRVASRAIYRIWPDFEIKKLTTRSVATVKADAARRSFSALGSGIVWAVMDSGIDETHPHFEKHKNLDVSPPVMHRDFTALGAPEAPLVDNYGHGTHVAGILAGEADVEDDGTSGRGRKKKRAKPVAVSWRRDERNQVLYDRDELDAISGMAPRCKLVSLKVLDDEGRGEASNLIAAIAQIQELNGHGRRILIHGVNMSVGYDFEPEWFACGQSPLCVEVDRLVKSGVVVVVAAGNTGYGVVQSDARGAVRSGLNLTINDPGNAELAITVGSTHREMPHIYGVSYFSSKGPTGDGRAKPDLVAPGEKILSCATGAVRGDVAAKLAEGGAFDYVEDSGTSMAAPHVAGVIAAFLSVRREFIGKPEEVKRIFLSTATDLKRERQFQGFGLVDLMRAIQSV